MKKLLAIAVVVVAVLFAAVYFLFDADSLRGQVQQKLSASLQKPVSLGHVGIGIFPPELRVSAVQIGDDPPLAKLDTLRVRIGVLALLRGAVDVQSLVLEKPVIELVEKPVGHWNYETTKSDDKSNAQVAVKELMISDGQIAITKFGQPRDVYDHIDLTLRDYAPGQTFTADLKMSVADKLDLAANVRARQDQNDFQIDTLTANVGKVKIEGKGKWSDQNTDLDVTLDRSQIEDLAKTAATFGKAFSEDMKVSGEVGAHVKLTGPSNRLAYNGDVEVAKLSVSAPKWTEPVQIAQAKIELTPDTIRAAPFEITSGQTSLTVSGTANGYAADHGDFEATVKAPSASLEALAHMAALYGGADLAGVSGTGKVSLDVMVRGKLANGSVDGITYAGSGSLSDATLNLPQLTKPLTVQAAMLNFTGDQVSVQHAALGFGATHLDGSVAVKGFQKPDVTFQAAIDQLDTDELQKAIRETPAAPKAKTAAKATSKPSQPMALKAHGTLTIGKLASNGLLLQNVKTTCAVDNGIVRLDPVAADLFSGHETGSITIDTRGTTSSFAMKSHLDKVDSNQLLTATTSLKQMIFGALASDANIKFAPKPGEDIARSLNGNLSLKLANGKLSGVNLVNELAGVARVLGFRKQGDAVTNILGLTGNLAVDNGTASTQDLKLVFDGGSLAAAGTVGLVDQSLHLKLTATMNKAFSDQFGGNKAGDILNAVFAGSGGEMVIPANVSGTFTRPLFVPDAAEMAKLRARSLVPSSAKGIFDAVTGKGGQQTGDGQQQSNPADAIINIFKKPKK